MMIAQHLFLNSDTEFKNKCWEESPNTPEHLLVMCQS